MFPNSVRFSSLNLATNPYELDIADHRIIGHSGQPVKDILKQTSYGLVQNDSSGDVVPDKENIAMNVITSQEPSFNSSPTNFHDRSSIIALRNTLVWGHMCPTAPST